MLKLSNYSANLNIWLTKRDQAMEARPNTQTLTLSAGENEFVASND